MEQLEGTLSVTVAKKGKIFKAKFVGKKGPTELGIFPQSIYFNTETAKDGDPIIIERDGGQIKKVTIKGQPEVAQGGGAQPAAAPQGGSRPDNRQGGGYQQGGQRPYDNRQGGGYQQQRGGYGQGGGYQQGGQRPYDNRQGGGYQQQRGGYGQGGGGYQGGQRGGYQQRSGGFQAQYANIPPATAPYNFIQQECVLEAPKLNLEDRYSGTIVCKLTTLTPLMIGDVQSRNQSGNEIARKEFMNVNGKYSIFGTTINGLLRSTVEILTCSAMNTINNRRIFSRNFNDANYRAVFGVGNQDRPQRAGYLVRKGADFEIIPVPYTAVRIGSPTNPGKTRVCTGRFARKNHDYDFDSFQAHAHDRGLSVADSIIDDFILQVTPAQEQYLRRYNIDGASGISRMQDPLPVFFLVKNGVVDSFGVALFFRYPRRYSTVDLRDNTMPPLPEGQLDFAMQLFGYAQSSGSLSGRVSSSAAFFQEKAQTKALPPMVLSRPHPSCFPHYLQQDTNNMRTMPKNTSQWDVNTMTGYDNLGKIRGRKLYWHRDLEVPQLDIKSVRSQSILQPIDKGYEAEFTIFVDRVSLVELGAVLEALLLPEGHAHKLGMGKAYGLGSVRIELKESTVKKCSDLYANIEERCLGFYGSKAPTANKQDDLFAKARSAFQQWLLASLEAKGKKYAQYDLIPHIQSFRLMTDFAHKVDNAKTRNMDLRDFRASRVLPTPSEVINGKR